MTRYRKSLKRTRIKIKRSHKKKKSLKKSPKLRKNSRRVSKKRSLRSRSRRKKVDGTKSTEAKIGELIANMKNIDSFKEDVGGDHFLSREFELILRGFIERKSPDNLIRIMKSKEYISFDEKKQQLLFIILIQQIIIWDDYEIDISVFFLSPVKESELSDDAKNNILYIFKFYELLLKTIKSAGEIEIKKGIRNIIENLFYVYDYEKQVKDLIVELINSDEKTDEKTDEKPEVKKIAKKGGKVLSSTFYNDRTHIRQKIIKQKKALSEMDNLFVICKFFKEDKPKENYISLYNKVMECLGVHFKLTIKRKLLDVIINIYSRKTTDDNKHNVFFLIYFLKCSGYNFGERMQDELPPSLIHCDLIKNQYNVDDHYMYFYLTGNKLRNVQKIKDIEGKELNLNISQMKINYIADLFYDNDDKDDKNICSYDRIIIKEDHETIVKKLFRCDDVKEEGRILKTLFEFLFIKYYIYFNSEKIYTDGDIYSDDKIYNENINQVMSLFRCIQKYIPKKKESRTSLFMNMFGFFRKIIDFHNYQMNIYKCLFDEDDQIKTILYDLDRRNQDLSQEYVREMQENMKEDSEKKKDSEEKRLKIIAELLEEDSKKESVKKEPVKKEPSVKKEPDPKKIAKKEEAEKEKMRLEAEQERRKERKERLRLEKERKEKEERERIEREKMENEEMKRKKLEEEEMKRKKIIIDRDRRAESLIEIEKYEIKLDCLDKIKIIDDVTRATYVIFGELFYEYIAFLTKLLEEKELFYIIVMGGSSIEKQCSEYKTNDVDVKFIPYDINTIVEYNDDNYKFIIDIINKFVVNKLSLLFTNKSSLQTIYNKIETKFVDRPELNKYKDALYNSINCEQDRNDLKKDLFSLSAFVKPTKKNFESKSSIYQKIIIDLKKLQLKNRRGMYSESEIIDSKTIMDVSILKSNPKSSVKSTNIHRKLMKAIGHEFMFEKNRRVPKFHRKDGLNLVDIEYLLKEKELLMNSNIDDPEHNFIDVEEVDDEIKEDRFKYVKDKSVKQYGILQECKKRLEKKS
jgi:hypothetical protein